MNRTETAHDDLFSAVDTEEKAYFLGLLAANSSVRGDALQVTQDASREGLVRRLHAALGTTATVGHTRGSVRFQVRSARLVADLAARGVLPRAARRNRSRPWHAADEAGVPGGPPVWLQRHYWRGYVDGKGGLVDPAEKRHFYLYGRRPVLRAFAAFCRREAGVRADPRPSAGDPTTGPDARHELHLTTGAEVRAVAALLYTGASVYDDRNRERALALARPAPARPAPEGRPAPHHRPTAQRP